MKTAREAPMRILFVGDLVGRPGRELLRDLLPGLKERHRPGLTVVNVENAAGGFGLTPKLARQILNWGADVMTSGNHIWDKRDILPYFREQPRLLRPGNYPPSLPGSGAVVAEAADGSPVAVLNAQGRVFMPLTDCPFRWLQAQVRKLREVTPRIVVDFHAEATSEKQAVGFFLDGQVSAVIGTHTHVPTADAQILPGGTAYLTDAGMTGSRRSVIGMRPEGALQRFLTGVSARLKVSDDDCRLSGALIDINPADGKALSIQPITAPED